MIFTSSLIKVYKQARVGYPDDLLLEQHLAELLMYLLQVHHRVQRQVNQIDSIKSATKGEIYKRLARSTDYLQVHFMNPISLDDLSQISCLSKFHYLRLFKTCFQKTPHQYLTEIRLDRARHLLVKTQIPIGDIALNVGFENFSSFSRLFSQKFYPYTPQKFRFSFGKQSYLSVPK